MNFPFRAGPQGSRLVVWPRTLWSDGKRCTLMVRTIPRDWPGLVPYGCIAAVLEVAQDRLKKPQLAQERARKHDFVESFEYCLPHTSDYKMLDSEHYRMRGQEALALVDWLYVNAKVKEISSALQVLHMALDQLAGYKTRDFAAQEMAVLGAAKVVDDWWSKAPHWGSPEKKEREALVAAMPDSLMHPSHLYHALKNTITDMKDFLLD